jgi:PEP-CTERM motif
MKFNRFLVGALMAAASFAAADAQAKVYDFDFSFSDGVTASGTLDIVSGQAISGSGELTSSFWSGSDAISLVTLTTPGVHDLGGGNLSFRYGGGTDLIGDTSVPIDSNGLVFSVTTNPDLDVGFNVWSTNGDASYTGFLAGDKPSPGAPAIYEQADGTGSITAAAVPEPATWAVMLAGFGAVGATLRSGRRRQLA